MYNSSCLMFLIGESSQNKASLPSLSVLEVLLHLLFIQRQEQLSNKNIITHIRCCSPAKNLSS